LADAEDYAAFEMAVSADHDAQSAVERELVLRLASLLWRLRRATAIENGLFEIQAKHLLQFRRARPAHDDRLEIIESMYPNAVADDDQLPQAEDELAACIKPIQPTDPLISSTISHDPLSGSVSCRPSRSTG
jgi:hypothetical protein